MKSLPVMLTAGVAFIGLVTTSNAKAANLGGSLFSTGGDVWVQVLKGDARDTSSLNLYSPQFQYIANNREKGGSRTHFCVRYSGVWCFWCSSTAQTQTATESFGFSSNPK